MAKDYAVGFYNSKAWKRCRDAFMQSKYYMCERCGGVAVIAHHRNYITPENINDPNTTLDWDNLEAVCQDCHNFGARERRGDSGRRFIRRERKFNFLPPT